MKERHASWSWCRRRATVDDWKKKSGFASSRRKKRQLCVSVHGCCFDSVMEQLFTLGATHARQQIQALQEEFNRRFEVPATLVHMAGGEERGEEVEEEPSTKSSQSPNGSISVRWAQ